MYRPYDCQLWVFPLTKRIRIVSGFATFSARVDGVIGEEKHMRVLSIVVTPKKEKQHYASRILNLLSPVVMLRPTIISHDEEQAKETLLAWGDQSVSAWSSGNVGV